MNSVLKVNLSGIIILFNQNQLKANLTTMTFIHDAKNP